MKINYLITILLVGFSTMVMAQGVNFQKLSLEEARSLAQKEGKMLFVDLSMNGCGPCVYMSEKIFPLKEVGDYYNERFVSVHYNISIDTTANALARTNNVKGFPSFLFIDPTTNESIHLALGGKSAQEIIMIGEMALTPNKGSFAVSKKYMNGDRDFNAMVDYYFVLLQQGEPAKMRNVINEMAKIWGQEFKDKDLNDFFFECVYTKDNTLSQYFLNNSTKMVQKFGKEKVYKKLGELR